MISRRNLLLALLVLVLACSTDVRNPAPALDERPSVRAAPVRVEAAVPAARLEAVADAAPAPAALVVEDPERWSTLYCMDDPGDWGPSQIDEASDFLEAYALLCAETVRCRADDGQDVEACNGLLDRFAVSYPAFGPLLGFWKGRNYEVRGDLEAAEVLYDGLARSPAVRQAVWMKEPLLARVYRRRVDIALSREDLPRALSLLHELEGALGSFVGFEETRAAARYEIAKCKYFQEATRPEALAGFRSMKDDPLLPVVRRVFMAELLDFEDWVARGGGANLPRDVEEAIHTLLAARRDPAEMETIVVDGERLRPVGAVQMQDPEGLQVTNLQESLSLVMTSSAPLYVDRAKVLVRGRDVLVRICEGRGDDPGVCEIHNFRSTRLGWIYAGRVTSTDPGDGAGGGEVPAGGVTIGSPSLSALLPPPDGGEDGACASGTPLAQEPDFGTGGPGSGPAGRQGACLTRKAMDKGTPVEVDLGCDWVEDLDLWPEDTYSYAKSQVLQAGTDRVRIGTATEQNRPFTYADVKIENECHLRGTGVFCSEYAGYDKDGGPGRDPVLDYALRKPRDSRFLDRVGFKAPFAAGMGFSAGGLGLSRELLGVDWFGAAPSGMGPSSPSAVNAVAYGLCQNGEKTGACARKVCGNFGGGALYNATGIYMGTYAASMAVGAVGAALGPVYGPLAALSVAAQLALNKNELPYFSTHFSTGASENIFSIDFSRSARNARGKTVRACRGERILATQEGHAAGVQNNIPSGNGACDVADFMTGFSHCIKGDEQDGNHVTIHHLKRLDALKCLSTGADCGQWDYKSTAYHLMGPLHYFSEDNRRKYPEAQTHWSTGQVMQGGVLVEQGMYLLQGTRLGYCDDTGISTLDHLHFEIEARVKSLPSKAMETYAAKYKRRTGKDKKTVWNEGDMPDFMETHSVPQLLEGELLLTPGQCLVSSNEEPRIRWCASDRECGRGQWCNKPPKFLKGSTPAGICSSRCIRDDQCPKWYRCDRENTGTCTRPDGCRVDGDCPPGFHCGRDARYGDDPICIGCRSNADCGAGRTHEEKVQGARYQLCARSTKPNEFARAWNRSDFQACRGLHHKAPDGFLYDECAATEQCPTGSRCMKLETAERVKGETRQGKGFDPVKIHYGTPDTWRKERELVEVGEDRGVCVAIPDRDLDWVFDDRDNCVEAPNPGQEDADGNGIGDACDQALSIDVILQDGCGPPQDHWLGRASYSFLGKAFAPECGAPRVRGLPARVALDEGVTHQAPRPGSGLRALEEAVFAPECRSSTVWGLPFTDSLDMGVRLRYENFVPTPVVVLTFYACPGDCSVQDVDRQKPWFNEVASSRWRDAGRGCRTQEIRRTVRSFLCEGGFSCNGSGKEGRTYSLFMNVEVNHSDPALGGYGSERFKIGTYQIVDPVKHSPCPGTVPLPGSVDAVTERLLPVSGYDRLPPLIGPEAEVVDRIRVGAFP